MELQRHASILLRLSDVLLHLTGEVDGGKGSDEVRANISATLGKMREQIRELEAVCMGWTQLHYNRAVEAREGEETDGRDT